MKRNIWPYAIIGYFVVFITGMVAWISFAMRHDEQLVRADYYEHEIKFQKQIDSANRGAAVRSDLHIRYHPATRSIVLAFPAGHADANAAGKIQLYRPSDAHLDREIPLKLDRFGSQTLDVQDLQPGYWKIQLTWAVNGLEYYASEPLVLEK